MAFDIRVKIDRAELRLGKLPDDFRAALRAEIDAKAVAIRDDAKNKAGEFFHVRSGRFVNSIRKSVRSSKTQVVGKVFSKNPVAHLLERGVKPHDIKPKNARALRFFGFKLVFSEGVHHPGFRGHTIINAAFNEMKAQLRDGMATAVQRAATDNATK